MGKLINIDNGGTLTDFCAFDGERLLFTKTLTTPHDLSTCFFEGLTRLSKLAYGEEDVARLLQETDHIRYSTTQGTNALVERRGPRLGVICSSEPALETLRSDNHRRELFSALVGDRVRIVDPLLKDDALDSLLTTSVNELAASGANRIVVSLDAADPETVERRFERIVLRRYPAQLLGALPVAFAADMSRDPDYARRTWSAIFNAFLHPAMERFLYGAEHRMKRFRTRNPLLIFRNDGGSARVAKTIALKTYSSGPRGGMEGAREFARHYGFDKFLSIDVGGTTTDVGIVANGELLQDHYGTVEGVPVSAPLCRVHSEGVGGSSVIRVQENTIQVGPNSVGAAPGPACFGRGGSELTITDVLLLNGVIDPATYFGGELALDAARAESAVNEAIMQPLSLDLGAALSAAESAWIAKIVNGVQRRVTTIESDTVIAGFGGGGPMLLTAIADALGAEQAIIPGMAAVFSAYGIGFSDLSQHYQIQIDKLDDLASARAGLLRRAERDMFAEGSAIEDCRLNWSLIELAKAGESISWDAGAEPPSGLKAPVLLRLEASMPIARVTLRADANNKTSVATSTASRRIRSRDESTELPLYRFQDLEVGAAGLGPCIVEDDFFTARIDAGWQFRLTGNRDLLLSKGSDN